MLDRTRAAIGTAAATTALALGLAMLLVADAGRADAAAASPRPVAITVSFPKLYPPIVAVPGRSARGVFYVTDPTSAPVRVSIVSSEVVPANNGALRMLPHPDPRFAGRISFSPTSLVVAAHHTATVRAVVRIPRSLAPDVYLVGVLVVPASAGAGIRNVGAVGAIMALGVPGPVHNRLSLSWRGPGFWDLGGPSKAAVRVTDTGAGSYFAFGQVNLSASPAAPSAPLTRVHPELLLPARWRDVAVPLSGGFFGLGLFHVHAVFQWPLRPDATTEASLSRTVLVVPVWALAAAGVLVLAPPGWWWRRRRKKARARPAPGPAPAHLASSAPA